MSLFLTSDFFVLLSGTGRLHLTVSSHWSLSFLKASRFEVLPKIALEASQSPVFLSVTVFSLDWRTLGQFSSVQVGSCHLAEALEGLMVAAAAGGGGGSIRPDRGSHVATSAPPHRTAQQTPALPTHPQMLQPGFQGFKEPLLGDWFMALLNGETVSSGCKGSNIALLGSL